jgi:hypothetical protein
MTIQNEVLTAQAADVLQNIMKAPGAVIDFPGMGGECKNGRVWLQGVYDEDKRTVYLNAPFYSDTQDSAARQLRIRVVIARAGQTCTQARDEVRS